jgi:heme exporter protein B
VLIFGVSATTMMMGPQTPVPSLLILAALTLLSLVVAPLASAAALRAYLQ